MLPDPIAFALQTPGHLQFSSNRECAVAFDRTGGRVERLATGHLIFYRSDGRRFLATDPAGHPLHECEWHSRANGSTALRRARVRLDWGRWVGLKPNGLINQTVLNLASKPGWQRLQPDDLRAMAAQALRLPIEEVRWFYLDDDLNIDPKGLATIRHRRDALYVLEEGDFGRATFMSCMGAMHWENIDFLPVVELFQSLLPGTGSAVFELIRGLYDDQNQSVPAATGLRYRGIPTYPSEAAFKLFSSFFAPQIPVGKDGLALFMDPARAHEIYWLPASEPPVRYFDSAQGVCLTVRGSVVQKATVAADSTGVPYVNPAGRPVVHLDRSLHLNGDQLILKDRAEEKTFKIGIPTGLPQVPSSTASLSPVDWRVVFRHGVPVIPSQDAYGAVLLYPENDQEIGELAAQPFVADYLQDLGEQDREIGAIMAHAERVWIDNGDAVIATCVQFDRPREYQARFHHAAYAQRQAQRLWMQCAEIQRWEWLHRIRFVPKEDDTPDAAQLPYDVIYQWVPYERFDSPLELRRGLEQLRMALRDSGHAFITGPSALRDALVRQKFHLCWEEPIEQLPTFRMHQTILPLARLKAGLTLFHVRAV